MLYLLIQQIYINQSDIVILFHKLEGYKEQICQECRLESHTAYQYLCKDLQELLKDHKILKEELEIITKAEITEQMGMVIDNLIKPMTTQMDLLVERNETITGNFGQLKDLEKTCLDQQRNTLDCLTMITNHHRSITDMLDINQMTQARYATMEASIETLTKLVTDHMDEKRKQLSHSLPLLLQYLLYPWCGGLSREVHPTYPQYVPNT